MIISKKEFKKELKDALKFISKNPFNYAISHVFLYNDFIVTADGYILYEKETKIFNDLLKNDNIFLNYKDLKIFFDELNFIRSDEVKIKKEKDFLIVSDIQETKKIKLLYFTDIQYPDYKRIIPQAFKINLTIDKNELKKIKRYVKIYKKSFKNTVLFTFSNKTIEITFFQKKKSDDYYTIREKIKINKEFKINENLTIAYDLNYLKDILSVFNEKIEIGITGDSSQTLFTSKNKNIVLMPVRKDFLNKVKKD